MTPRVVGHPYARLVHYKRWADRGLYDVVGQNLDRLADHDAVILLRTLDHIHVVDRIFQHHLQGLPHAFPAPRSDAMPDFGTLATSVRDVDDWYASHVERLQVGSSRVDLQACKLEYSIVSPK